MSSNTYNKTSIERLSPKISSCWSLLAARHIGLLCGANMADNKDAAPSSVEKDADAAAAPAPAPAPKLTKAQKRAAKRRAKKQQKKQAALAAKSGAAPSGALTTDKVCARERERERERPRGSHSAVYDGAPLMSRVLLHVFVCSPSALGALAVSTAALPSSST